MICDRCQGTRKHAEAVREACRAFLEDELKLTLNMEKTHITDVNDGFRVLVIASSVGVDHCGRMLACDNHPVEKYRGSLSGWSSKLSADFA